MIRKSWMTLRGALLLFALLFAYPLQAAFTVNADGTVTDSATGLIWDQCSWGLSGTSCSTGSAGTYTWAPALTVAVTANSISYKGRTDWRLPNRNELESLINLSRASPAIDTLAFPGTPAYGYWSSTIYPINTANAGYANFADGDTDIGFKTYSLYVRLVRNGPSFGSFDALAPSSPFNVVAVVGNASARVSFSAPGGNGAVVSGYTVRTWAIVFGGAAVTEPVATDIDAGSLSLNHTIINLVNGTAYTFTVTAHGSEGDSLESVPSASVVPSREASAPVCTLTAMPARVSPGRSSTLIASCSPTANSYTWTGDTCTGTSASTCTVTPALTTRYSVTGINSYGSSSPASATVTIRGVDLTPILMLLLD